MTTLYVDDFRLGLDVRKSVLTAQPGSLQQLDNCVITPGGEVQKRLGFAAVATLTPGTVGLYGTVLSGQPQLYVFEANTTGTPGAFTSLGQAGPAILSKHTLAGFATTYFLGRVYGVQEYGASQLFVTGELSPSTNQMVLSNQPWVMSGDINWWKGNQVTQYIGVQALTSGAKMYRVNGATIYFSGVGDPSVTNPLNPAGTGPNTVNPGAGFIDCSQLDKDARALTGIEAYYKQIAVFSRRVTLLWSMDPNAANNVLQQVLRIGTVAGSSVRQFGSGDVLFLSDNGVRSLRVLNVSLAAGVTDVGSPIDLILQPLVQANPLAASVAQAIIEPLTGRYWLAIGNTIYVLSAWPSSKISAWSTFTLPFNVDYITTAANYVFIRSGETIYMYGGPDGLTYDTSVATLRTPLMAADTPSTKKKAVSIGAMVQGNWQLGVCMDPDNPTVFETCANLTKATYAMETIPFVGFGSHIGFKLTSSDAGPSLVGALTVRFDKSTEP